MEYIRENKWQISMIVIVMISAIVFTYAYYVHPLRRLGPEQPIPFSHRVHAGVKQIQCEFCHPYASRSHYPGIPPVEKCLFCHTYIIPLHPEIRKEHDYFNTKTPTPWRKVFYVPEHVFFNHKRHIKNEIACEECHGLVEVHDRLKRVDFQMGFCITCHRIRDATLDCWLACHN